MLAKNTGIRYSRRNFHFLWSLGLILSLVSMVVCGSIAASELNYLPGRIRLECQDSYSPGENVQVKLFVINQSAETATYGMTYNVKIYDVASNLIWTKDFVIYGKVIVSPGSEAALPDFVWDQKDKDGLQVNSGDYRIAIRLWQDNVAGEKTITIRAEEAKTSQFFNFLKRLKIFNWFLEHWR
jgi:hypothetical protein